MKTWHFWVAALLFANGSFAMAQEPRLIAQPDAFETLVNPMCSHCGDEAKRRASDLRADDRVLCWIRGYSDGGVIPYRFFLNRMVLSVGCIEVRAMGGIRPYRL
jgi:hypothetical protein